MASRRKIILHGYLAERYPHVIEVEAETVAEALGVISTIPELNDRQHHVRVEGCDNEIALAAKSDMEEIHVLPITGGGGGGSRWGQIAIGVLLVAVGFLTGGIGFLGISQGQLILTGVLLVTGGLLQYLVPTPDTTEETEQSRYLPANQNTVEIGTRIPISYGFVKMSGHYLSFDVDSIEVGDDGSSDAIDQLVGDSDDVEHDKTTVDIGPVLPIFSGAVTGPGNIPTAGWTP